MPQCWLEEGLKKGQSHRNTLYNQLRLIHIDRDCQQNIEASIGVAPEGKSDASQVGIQHMPEPVTTRNRVRRWWKNFTRDVGVKKIRQIHEHVATVPRETTQWQTRFVPPETHGKRGCKNLVLTKNASSVTKNCKKQHRLCSRGARCADNQRGERCCAQRPCVAGRNTLLTRVLWSELDDTSLCDLRPRRPREMVTLWLCLPDCSSCPCYYELEDAAPACCAPNKNSATLGD